MTNLGAGAVVTAIAAALTAGAVGFLPAGACGTSAVCTKRASAW